MQQLRHATALLDRAGVPHWVDCGTLLGLVREGRPLQGDKDIDLGVWSQDVPGLLGAKAAFRREGFRMVRRRYHGRTYGVDLLPRKGVPISIGVHHRHERHAWRLATYFAANPHRRWSLRFLLKGVWRMPVRLATRLLYGHLDVGRLARTWPFSTQYRVATWWIPSELLEGVVEHPSTGLPVPARAEALLEAHYGDWRTPASDYLWWRDDRLVHHTSPERLMADLSGDASVLLNGASD